MELAQACESRPIRADWAFRLGSLETGATTVNRDAAEIDSMRKCMCFVNIKLKNEHYIGPLISSDTRTEPVETEKQVCRDIMIFLWQHLVETRCLWPSGL